MVDTLSFNFTVFTVKLVGVRNFRNFMVKPYDITGFCDERGQV